MLALYIAALVLAAGAIVLQFAVGHDTGAGGHDASHTSFDDHDFAPWTLLTSLRFWSFGLLAFGLVGTSVTLLGLAGVVATAILAGVVGLASGSFAAIVVRRMMQRSASSNVTSDEIVGKMGRVLVVPGENGRGKVRVEIKGSLVDYAARAGEPLTEGDLVVIEECDGQEVAVSRAPRELKP